MTPPEHEEPRKAEETHGQSAGKKEKWTALEQEDFQRAADGFIHLNPKTVHSAVSGLGFRLPYGRPRRELPYIALTVLGASHRDLDFTEGGARFIRKPRQIKDGVTGESSGVLWTHVPHQDEVALSQGQALEQQLRQPHQLMTSRVPPLLRQVILPDASGKDVVLTPMGAMGLNRQILERLEQARQARTADPEKPASRFWNLAMNNLGGAKPQNVGLMGTVVGGKRLASFAWLFPAPKFPGLGIRKALAVLFRDFRVSLGAKEAKALRKALENHEENPDFSSKRSLLTHARELARKVQASSVAWRQELERQLWRDVQADRKREPDAHSEVNTPAQAWLAAWEEGKVPETNRSAWETALSKSDDELAWFLTDRRTHAWSKTAAERVAGQWLGQLRLPISQPTRTVLEKAISQELMA